MSRMNEWKIPLHAVGPRYTPLICPINLDLEILEKDRKKQFSNREWKQTEVEGRLAKSGKMGDGEEENGQW